MTFLQKNQCTCMWKYLFSENKVIKDDNHLILILIYDIFAEKLMDFETELSNEIGFIKVDNSGLEAGDRN